MRTLADRHHEQARANADDRELESRTDRRRQQDAHETKLKALATRLSGMKPSALERLALDDETMAAILTAQAIRSAPARNRQVNVVRQHLRALGPALDALIRRLEEPAKAGPARTAPPVPARQTSAEVLSWSERLAEEGDSALAAYLELRPAADRQQLRQRMRELSRARMAAVASAVAAAEARLRAAVEAGLRE